MKISIFGLGYVGAVSAGCLARDGHEVVGVDPNPTKVDLLRRGQSPIIEKDLGEILHGAVREGRLRATSNAGEAIECTEMSLVCVGTPSLLNGGLDLKHVRFVCEEIGTALRGKRDFHVVAIRSTMLPGSMRGVVIPTLEAVSSGQAGVDFGICFNPEFLREGSSVYDFFHPPKTVIGEIESRSGAIVAGLFKKIDAPLIRTDMETAEMVKYVDNVWHALKVGYANEVGNICKAVGIDGRKVMEIFCQDTKLNLSSCYLKPGFAFGGSCLPKDVRALVYKARTLDLELPILNAILPSNGRQVDRGMNMITTRGNKRIGVLGISFKAGTDDLRESPVVEVVERLLGKGYDVRLYDPNVKMASLVGANRDYILNHIPHISRLLEDTLEKVLDHAQTVVIGNDASEFRGVPGKLRQDQVLVDFVRIADSPGAWERYDGICW